MSTTAESLNALADRVEREEPSRLLDADIFEAVTGRLDFNKADKSFRERGSLLLLTEDDRLNWVYAPAYTTSLDAAVTLFPSKQWGVNWAIEGVHARGFPDEVAICTYVWVDHPTNEASFVRSPGVAEYPDALKWLPRLITAAALRARAALLTDGTVGTTNKGQDPQSSREQKGSE